MSIIGVFIRTQLTLLLPYVGDTCRVVTMTWQTECIQQSCEGVLLGPRFKENEPRLQKEE